MLGISAVEKYFWLGLKYLIPLQKNIMLYINYCTNYNYIHNLFYVYIHKSTLNAVYMNKTNTSPRNSPLSCYRSVNPFLSKALLFVATSH